VLLNNDSLATFPSKGIPFKVIFAPKPEGPSRVTATLLLTPEISGRGKNRASNLNLNSNVCPVLSAKLYELLAVASPVITSVVNGLTTSNTPSAPATIGSNSIVLAFRSASVLKVINS
jgi:hypothetical protein